MEIQKETKHENNPTNYLEQTVPHSYMSSMELVTVVKKLKVRRATDIYIDYMPFTLTFN